MEDAVFRASSVTDIDPDWVDSQVVGVLTRMTGVPWRRTAWVYLVAPVIESTVDIAGAATESITVRVSKGDCARIANAMGVSDHVTPQELVSELVNTIAGHVKVGMADGLATGIPRSGVEPQEAGRYKAVFSSDGILVEVTSHV